MLPNTMARRPGNEDGKQVPSYTMPCHGIPQEDGKEVTGYTMPCHGKPQEDGKEVTGYAMPCHGIRQEDGKEVTGYEWGMLIALYLLLHLVRFVNAACVPLITTCPDMASRHVCCHSIMTCLLVWHHDMSVVSMASRHVC